MKEAGLELDSYKKEHTFAEELIEFVCEEVCDEMWPEGLFDIGTAHVWCQRDGKTQTCNLLQIGTRRRPPPFDVVMEMARRVARYGISERPAWYPLHGMF